MATPTRPPGSPSGRPALSPGGKKVTPRPTGSPRPTTPRRDSTASGLSETKNLGVHQPEYTVDVNIVEVLDNAIKKDDLAKLQRLLHAQALKFMEEFRVGNEEVSGEDLALHTASYIGHDGSIKYLLTQTKHKYDIDKLIGGLGPIHHAAGGGQESCLRLLADKGAKLDLKNMGGHTALHMASAGGHTASVEVLLEKGATASVRDKGGVEPVHCAAYNGHIACIDALAKQGKADIKAADELGRVPLHWIAMGGFTKAALQLIKMGAPCDTPDKNKRTPLHYAAFGGNSMLCMALIDQGANVEARDAGGRTPLAEAADSARPSVEEERVKVARVLIKKGADPHSVDNFQQGLIHRAALAGSAGFCKLLVKEHKVPVDQRESQQATALHYAATSSSAVIHLLVELGATINARDTNRRTPLHWAAGAIPAPLAKPPPVSDDFERVRILIAKKGDVNALDKDYFTAVDFCEHKEGVVTLTEAGGKSGADIVNKAATYIQAFAIRFIWRRWFRRLRRATIRIQRWWRIKRRKLAFLRAMAANQARRQREAEEAARRRVELEYERKQAATKIQRWFRRVKHTRKMIAIWKEIRANMVKERGEAAVKIQRWYRHVKRVDRKIRQWRAVRESMVNQRGAAAKKIQRWYRHVKSVDRKIAQWRAVRDSMSTERNEAACKIQRWYRHVKSVDRKIKQWRIVRNSMMADRSAIKIQRWYRHVKSVDRKIAQWRRVREDMLAEKSAAALKIQRWWRALQAVALYIRQLREVRDRMVEEARERELEEERRKQAIEEARLEQERIRLAEIELQRIKEEERQRRLQELEEQRKRAEERRQLERERKRSRARRKAEIRARRAELEKEMRDAMLEAKRLEQQDLRERFREDAMKRLDEFRNPRPVEESRTRVELPKLDFRSLASKTTPLVAVAPAPAPKDIAREKINFIAQVRKEPFQPISRKSVPHEPVPPQSAPTNAHFGAHPPSRAHIARCDTCMQRYRGKATPSARSESGVSSRKVGWAHMTGTSTSILK